MRRRRTMVIRKGRRKIMRRVIMRMTKREE